MPKTFDARAIRDRFGWLTAVSSLVAIEIAYVVKGELGAKGMTLGIIGTGTSILAMWQAISVVGANNRELKPDVLKMLGHMIAALGLMPILFLCMNVCHKLGSVANGCFCGGIALVYSLLIGWGVLRVQLS